MKTISVYSSIDSAQDIHLDEHGNLAIATDQEDIKQRVIERLQYFFKEWFLAYEEGVPYFQDIFTRPVNSELVSSILTDQIRTVEGVLGVSNVRVEIDPITRHMTFFTIIQTEFGEIQIQNDFINGTN